MFNPASSTNSTFLLSPIFPFQPFFLPPRGFFPFLFSFFPFLIFEEMSEAEQWLECKTNVNQTSPRFIPFNILNKSDSNQVMTSLSMTHYVIQSISILVSLGSGMFEWNLIKRVIPGPPRADYCGTFCRILYNI